ncbi:hypothetical protein [Sorangium sp. So ce1024]|uniref:hypothetical protein n=1 Tax=Sorangium sp. So ce1024 TaxID=3133327 RepID=UPI003F003111
MTKRIGLGPAKWIGVGSAKRITTGKRLTAGRALGEREIGSSFRNASHPLSETATVGTGSAKRIAAGSAKWIAAGSAKWITVETAEVGSDREPG